MSGRRAWSVMGSVAAAVGGVLALSGCTSSITQARVNDAVGPTFAHLYRLQHQLMGFPPVIDPQASAQCQRTGRGVPNSGAGDDWICQLSLVVGGQFQSIYTYDLSVKADGCYVADGSPALVGGAMLTAGNGQTRVNPLFAFDGCFDS